MDDTGFQHLDFLQCCKFAEGDSRILMQKLARDECGRLSKLFTLKQRPRCSRTAKKLVTAMSKATSENAVQVWQLHWRDVYALAEEVMEEVVQKWSNASTSPTRVQSSPSSSLSPLQSRTVSTESQEGQQRNYQQLKPQVYTVTSKIVTSISRL